MVAPLSTRDLALAIGVSESSIKRWVDQGTIRSSRTAGGHRRIPVSEALRFVRESRASVVRPDILGLADLASVVDLPRGREGDRLFELLRNGAAAPARGLLQSMYLDGSSVAAIIDGPVRSAMQRIGELWQHDPAGIFVEHRATDICMQALGQLRAILPPPPDGIVAVGGAPEEDVYALPSLAAATVLAAEGLEAVNLGPQTPFASLLHAVERLHPRLVWVSVSIVTDVAAFGRALRDLAAALEAQGTSVVAGGHALRPPDVPAASNLHYAGTMVELAAFARGLCAGVTPPRVPAGSRPLARHTGV